MRHDHVFGNRQVRVRGLNMKRVKKGKGGAAQIVVYK